MLYKSRGRILKRNFVVIFPTDKCLLGPPLRTTTIFACGVNRFRYLAGPRNSTRNGKQKKEEQDRQIQNQPRGVTEREKIPNNFIQLYFNDQFSIDRSDKIPMSRGKIVERKKQKEKEGGGERNQHNNKHDTQIILTPSETRASANNNTRTRGTLVLFMCLVRRHGVWVSKPGEHHRSSQRQRAARARGRVVS